MNPLSGLATPHLGAPLWLLLLAAVPLLAWWHHRRHDPGALTYSRLPEPAPRRGPVRSAAGAGGAAPVRSWAGAWRLHLPFYFRLAAFALLVLALARPQLGYAWEESLTEGIDIQLVLDVSGSMAAEDFAPRNRLEVAKRVVRDFVAGRTGDRIGLTVFSGRAVTRSPLTTDRRMLGLLLDAVEVNTALDGTAIGVALANAAARLQDSEAESKVIVLVTDGVNNTGAIDPRSAAAVCDGLGIRVYTVGVGTRGRVVVPLTQRNPVTGRLETHRAEMQNQLDEELLRAIAERTGGRYFRATDARGLAGVFAAIDRLERTPMRVKRYVRYQETFQPLAWAALAALLAPLLAAALGVTAEP
ncbi:MAG TPA: VWA domain-containing protein [Thermoanaerobaculia bacterium]|nr:VWA domain-containing protein [Thermoanaerobaculia bacterium]